MPHERPEPAPVPIQSHLLYRRAVLPDFGALCDAMNGALGNKSAQLSVAAAPGRDAAMLSHPDYHVMIAVSRRAARRDILQDALGAAILKTGATDYEALVRRHCAHITVLVDHGAGPVEDGDTGAVDPVSPELHLRVLKAAVDAILDIADPLLIHWCQSRMIFTPQTYRRGAVHPLPLPLAIRPEPFAVTAEDGSRHIGIRADGSAQFAGATLIVDPAERPIEASVGLVLSMLIEKYAGRLPLGHGDVLDTPTGETLYLRHEDPDERDPAGRIVLALRPPAPRTPKAVSDVFDDAPGDATPETAAIDANSAPMADTGQAAFADRIARLRTDDAALSDADAPSDEPDLPPVSLTERESDPRLRLPGAAATARSGFPKRLAVPVLVLLLLLAARQFMPAGMFQAIATDLTNPSDATIMAGDTQLRIAPAPRD